MYTPFAVAFLVVTPFVQDPPPSPPAVPDTTARRPYQTHEERAEGLRTLSSQSAVAERELLYTTRPEERALDFLTQERSTRQEELALLREELEIREEELRALQAEHRELQRAGDDAGARAWLERNRAQVVRLLRSVTSLREEVEGAQGSQVRMGEAEEKLRALVDHKKSEARRYDREQAGRAFSEFTGIGPELVPGVVGGAREDAMSAEVAAMFDELFGAGFDLASFRTRVARSLSWSYEGR